MPSAKAQLPSSSQLSTPFKGESFPSYVRPSLSDQLKTISQGAQDITLHLNTTYKLQRPPLSTSNWLLTSPVLLQATTIGMTVGKLECRFPCPVHFAQDHCSYLFQHPYEAKEVRMVMFYRDMTQMQMNVREKCFQFRINHPLEQFGDDYKPENPQHAIKIVLATISEAQKVKQFIGDHKLWFPR
uniref:Uncharacterized protein n=1 Tax=Globisporangium ultimum (strain ATCC 200006 / CBS 805.95 / DAOM BR144) TaxID=431595 RepID=K3X5D5_GLOUD